MNKKVNVFLGIASAIMALVAVLTLFAPMFYNLVVDESWAGSEYGSVFQVMFYGYANKVDPSAGKAVGLFIVAFGTECLAFIVSFVCAALSGKKAVIGFAINAALLIFSGIVFLLGKQIFVAVNGEQSNPQFAESVIIGAGAICSCIFAFLGGLLSAYGVYGNLKN